MKAITLITTTIFIILFTSPTFAQNNGETETDTSKNLTGQIPIIQDRTASETTTIGFWAIFSRYWVTPKAYFSDRKRLGL